MIYYGMDESDEPGPKPTKPLPRFSFLSPAILILLACARAALAAEPTCAELEKEMLGLVNKDRKEHQKKPLEYHEGLAKIARAHSADMVENMFFSHKSKTTGNVGERLWAAKIKVRTCSENIAMNRSMEFAQARLMKSPGHRANILSELYTHCGIGIVRASHGVLYVTQVFGTPAPDVDPGRAKADIVNKINRARIARGRLPFKVVPALDGIASHHAAALARAGRPIRADLGALANAAGVKHRQISTVQLLTWDPRELARAADLLRPRLGRLGCGLAQNTKHRELGYGIFWAVVVFTSD